MKTLTFILIVLLFLASVQIQAQNKNSELKSQGTKWDKKVRFQFAKQLIKDTCFMIRVGRVDMGNMNYVSDRLSFMKVCKNEVLAQLVPYKTRNGLGGVTLEGKIERYDIKEKGNHLYLTLYVRHRSGFNIFNINLSGDDVALINGAFSGTVGLIDQSNLIVGIKY